MNIKIEKVPVFDFFTEVEKKYLDIRFAEFCEKNKIKKEVLIEAYTLGIACGVGVFLSRSKEK